jgi:hypothetical protein
MRRLLRDYTDDRIAAAQTGGRPVKSYMVLMIISWVAAYQTGSWWSVGVVFFAYWSGYISAKDGLG